MSDAICTNHNDQQRTECPVCLVTQLRARAERAEAVLSDPQQLHAHCLRTLNEGQIAHLFGERMTEIVNRAERAEAELAAIDMKTCPYCGNFIGDSTGEIIAGPICRCRNHYLNVPPSSTMTVVTFHGPQFGIDRDALRLAVNLSCSCGGHGPDDPMACPACMVWHRLALPNSGSQPRGQNADKLTP